MLSSTINHERVELRAHQATVESGAPLGFTSFPTLCRQNWIDNESFVTWYILFLYSSTCPIRINIPIYDLFNWWKIITLFPYFLGWLIFVSSFDSFITHICCIIKHFHFFIRQGPPQAPQKFLCFRCIFYSWDWNASLCNNVIDCNLSCGNFRIDLCRLWD